MEIRYFPLDSCKFVVFVTRIMADINALDGYPNACHGWDRGDERDSAD